MIVFRFLETKTSFSTLISKPKVASDNLIAVISRVPIAPCEQHVQFSSRSNVKNQATQICQQLG
jgi:hypothetical protein